LSVYKNKAVRLTLAIMLAHIFLNGNPHWFRSGRALADQLPIGAGFQVSSLVESGKVEAKETAKGTPYHTPLAGEAGQASFLGYPVEIPAQDRGHMTSITLGGTLLNPKQGDTRAIPFAALYLRRLEEDYRTRDTISIFVNELEYDRRFGNFELVGYFENYTLPGAHTELGNGHSINSTSVVWGTLLGAVGPGLRIPTDPFEVDNDLRIQFLGRAGYFYAGRNHDTGADQLLPPDTLLYGAKLRVRYDGMRRNLLELPHVGFAAGFDVDYLCRDKWRDLGGTTLSSGNRDYFQLNGYLVGAGGIPGLSERDRALFSLHAGTTAGDRGDRYNAFRINGGPFPSESDDLPRQHYTGIVYDDILAAKYATISLGYRRELAFFIYLSLVGSYLWADRVSAQDNGLVQLKNTTAVSSTASLDCAFFGNSEFYLAYAWDSGIIRGGRSGSGLLLTWNKLF
jgi:hypothetical protein